MASIPLGTLLQWFNLILKLSELRFLVQSPCSFHSTPPPSVSLRKMGVVLIDSEFWRLELGFFPLPFQSGGTLSVYHALFPFLFTVLDPLKHCPWNGPLVKWWCVVSHLLINHILCRESGELFLWFANLILTLSWPENAKTCPPTQLCLGF